MSIDDAGFAFAIVVDAETRICVRVSRSTCAKEWFSFFSLVVAVAVVAVVVVVFEVRQDQAVETSSDSPCKCQCCVYSPKATCSTSSTTRKTKEIAHCCSCCSHIADNWRLDDVERSNSDDCRRVDEESCHCNCWLILLVAQIALVVVVVVVAVVVIESVGTVGVSIEHC
jgi:hypothetical protein